MHKTPCTPSSWCSSSSSRPGQALSRQQKPHVALGLCCAGVRNDFLIASGAEMALRYNDVSVNENMHASLAHELLYKPGNNFVEHLQEDERRFMRRLIVASILSTDMSVHSDLVKVSALRDLIIMCALILMFEGCACKLLAASS